MMLYGRHLTFKFLKQYLTQGRGGIMAKNFAPRISKKERKTVSLADRLDRDIFKISDDKLLKGAKLEEVSLKILMSKSR